MRHRIEHGGAFRSDLRSIAAELDILVASQPGFLSTLGDGYLEALGPERATYLYPYASLQVAGILVAGSSDAPVIGASPFVGIRDAVLRRTDGGAIIAPAEALSPADALALYTRNAALATWAEERLGTLEVGKLADFVVVDRDPLAATPEAVAETEVRLTVVGGRVAFRRAQADSPRAASVAVVGATP
jgi:predicted amidohydrolase YtcJ